jgi:hypothetical protein
MGVGFVYILADILADGFFAPESRAARCGYASAFELS